MNYIKFNHKTTAPKQANAPSVEITGDILTEYTVSFYIQTSTGFELIKKVNCKTGETVFANYSQVFINWYITVEREGVIIASDTFTLENKVVFIKMDAYALGDNIAWIPYVEEFRKKHNATVICSTFYNDLFKDTYPDILFVKPNTNVDNVYSQIYIGASNDNNPKYSFISVNQSPLQYVAPSALNLPLVEIRPELEHQFTTTVYDRKYVCISEFASGENKFWKYENGWQDVVDYLKSIDYEVIVISKEPTTLNGVIDLTGDNTINSRAQLLKNAEFFIGVSSGLSWLSWAVNTHTFLISDVTQANHEFQSNVTRITANPDLKLINYAAPNVTTSETVINSIKKYLESKS
jgi:autotransporter strand-loop-strand O-heptosyltransferase